MDQHSDFEVYQFDNGFRLFHKRTPTHTIFANLRINHGALNEREGEEGTAHFLEHMLVEGGTERYAPGKQAKIRGMFGYTNAMTSRDRTMIPWGMIPYELDNYLDMSSQMVFHPSLDKKVLEQQKKVVMREISRAKGSPSFDDFFRFYQPNLTRDRDHTYFVLGKEEVIIDITEEKLRDFHSRGYNPNNMTLMISGDLPEDIVERVGKYFACQLSGNGEQFNLSPVSPLEKRVMRHSYAEDLLNKENPNGSNSYLIIGVVVPDEFHPDSAALRVASEVLGKSWTGGLKKKIRSEKGMSYDIGSNYSGDKRFGRFEVSGKIRSTDQDESIGIIFEELGKLGTVLPDESEVAAARMRASYKAANYISSSFGSLVTIDPVNVSSISMMDYTLEGRPRLEEKLLRISLVTPEDVKRVSEKYLPLDSGSNYVLLLRDPLKR